MPQVFANKDKAKVRVRIRRVAGGKGSRFKVKELVRNVEGKPPAATQFGFLLQTTDTIALKEDYYMEYRIKGR